MSELSKSDICTRRIPAPPEVICEEGQLNKECAAQCAAAREAALTAQRTALCLVYSTYLASMSAQLAELESALADCLTSCGRDESCQSRCHDQYDGLISRLQMDWALFRQALNAAWDAAVTAANATYKACAEGCCKDA